MVKESTSIYDELRDILRFDLPDPATQGKASVSGAAKDLQQRRNRLADIHLKLLRSMTNLGDQIGLLDARRKIERENLLLDDPEVQAGKNAEQRAAIVDRKLRELCDEIGALERKKAQLNSALTAINTGESTLRSAVRLLGLQTDVTVSRRGSTGDEDDRDSWTD